MAGPARILTTHVGSLPRPEDVSAGLAAQERGEAIDEAAFSAALDRAVRETVAAQIAAGIDIVSDGEMSKISYATYIKDRLTGFDGDAPRSPPRDLEDFPRFMARQSKGGGTPTYRRPMCVGEIHIKDDAPLQADLQRFGAEAAAQKPHAAFLTAASPGVIALFQPNRFYESQRAYLEALAKAMKPEYDAIVGAGFILQLDCPDLALGRNMMYKDKSDEEFLAMAHLHVDVLNEALADVPKDRVRLHTCWGNYEGPHHHDIPVEMLFPIIRRLKIGAWSYESCNPRHCHEWERFAGADLPEDLSFIPGMLDSTSNFIEHPEAVAQRLVRFADVVGRDRIIAGSDCGFSTFAGFGLVDPDIVWAKLKSLAQGAALASVKLWGRA